MPVQKLCDRVFSVGARDWDRRIFDELIPLPQGTSYNSYWIEGSEKNVLIDSVDPAKKDELLSNLKKLNVKKIDYLVSNHAEQDHSGSIPDLLEIFPQARVVTNEKCKNLLMDLLLISEDRFLVVQDGDTLSLGDKTLEFIFTPWVHWPETMCTLLRQDRILFSCDFFGSHLATSNLFVRDAHQVIDGAKRYYAEIMMPFRTIIKKNIGRIEEHAFDWIAPSHGPVYRESKIIIDAYKDWISDRVENEVVIAYVSMHGSTEKMIRYLIEKLMEKGITVKPFNLTRTDIGELAMALVDAASLVIGTPTVLAGPHPAAVYAATLVNALKPKLKFATVVGSFGWGGQTVETIKNNMNHLKVELLPPVLVKGFPGEEDYKMLDGLSETLYSKHKDIA